jgi:hypothetical protein
MISRVALPVLALAALCAARVCSAGEVVCFSPGEGKTCSQSSLQHVQFKAVVTEFIDPQQTTIGHSISRLMWREVLESISDLKDSGVILAYDARDQLRTMLEGRDYQTVLQRDYHNAAIRVANELGAQMTVWGAVLEHDGTLHVEPYLTLLPKGNDRWTKLQLQVEGSGSSPLSAEIANQRLSFAPLQTDRAHLFQHNWLTRCRLSAGCPEGIDVRNAPGNEAPVIGHVPVGSIVAGRDMHEQWVAIDRAGIDTATDTSAGAPGTGADSGPGYINVYHLEVVAPAVHVLSKAVRLRAQPSSNAAVLDVSAPAGATLETRGVQRAADDRLWYNVEVRGARGWVPPETVQRDYSFPVVHFIAGVYRYAGKDYGRAIQEFQRFIERGENTEDNVTLATAYQYLAASKVASGGTDGIMAARNAMNDLQQASRQTPYDPSVYVMSSLIRLGTMSDAKGALMDLRRSLDLDSQNPTAITLLTSLSSIAEAHRTDAPLYGEDPRVFKAEVTSLRDRQNTQ